jgi:hypothetical protein
MSMYIKSIEKAGLDEKKVSSIASRLSKVAREAGAMGITIFGGSGSGSLRFYNPADGITGRPLVIADLDGHFDGGDGACWEDEEGCLRGE